MESRSLLLIPLSSLWPVPYLLNCISVFYPIFSLFIAFFSKKASSFLKKTLFIFFQREEGREKERERNINVCLPLMRPLLGNWPTTQSCALTGNPINNPLVHRLVLSLLSHTSQGKGFLFIIVCLFISFSNFLLLLLFLCFKGESSLRQAFITLLYFIFNFISINSCKSRSLALDCAFWPKIYLHLFQHFNIFCIVTYILSSCHSQSSYN